MVNCRGERQPVDVYLVFMTLLLLFMCAWKYQRNAEIGCFNFIYVLVLLGFKLRVLAKYMHDHYWACYTSDLLFLTFCFET